MEHVISRKNIPEDVLRKEIDGICGSSFALVRSKELGKDIHLMNLKHEFDAVFLSTGTALQRRNDINDNGIKSIEKTVTPEFAAYMKKELKVQSLDVDPQMLNITGGDIIRGSGTVVQSVADGRRDAMAIDKALRKKS